MTTPAQHFCDLLYDSATRGHTAYFYLPSKQVQWFPIAERPVVNPLYANTHVYLNLSIRAQPTQGRRGTVDDVIGIPGLWLDLDFRSEGAHKASNLPPDADACMDLLNCAPHEPTLIIYSGHGLQAYWLFAEPWYFDVDLQEERALAARMMRGWQQWFQHAAHTRGWHVDSTHDLVHVLRVPGSQNVKTDPPRSVTIVEEFGPRYQPSDFLDYLAPEDMAPSVLSEMLTPQSVDIRPLKMPARIKYLILHGDSINEYPSRSEAVFAAIHGLRRAGCAPNTIAGVMLDSAYGISEMPREKGLRWIEGELARAAQKNPLEATAPETFEHVEEMSADDLLRQQFKPLEWLAQGLLHEGLVLFGGKSKRGKSWIMMNLAASIAVGGIAFGHYAIPQPAKVLYCALEDGPRRTQRRLKMLDPTQPAYPNLKFAFRMPALDDGGIEYITQHILDGYKLIVVDVMAHVEKAGKNGLRDYHEVYAMFAPIQALRNEHSFALVMITHLRKSESEEVFNDLHGSVAYQGTQDALWVLERKQGNDTALLHMRDKDAEDKVLELKFDGMALWTFLGEGEEYVSSQKKQEIIQVLREEAKPLSTKEIMLACGISQGEYETFRKRLQRMVHDHILVRLDRGKYGLLHQASFEQETEPPF